mmetsp:Transcript_19876/g.33456  ORF Transcript_19876/g.33456 Transcript_19876/m.33456 type:complete len:84 (+) Transcript_19876:737-988(+)
MRPTGYDPTPIYSAHIEPRHANKNTATSSLHHNQIFHFLLLPAPVPVPAPAPAPAPASSTSLDGKGLYFSGASHTDSSVWVLK